MLFKRFISNLETFEGSKPEGAGAVLPLQPFTRFTVGKHKVMNEPFTRPVQQISAPTPAHLLREAHSLGKHGDFYFCLVCGDSSLTSSCSKLCEDKNG